MSSQLQIQEPLTPLNVRLILQSSPIQSNPVSLQEAEETKAEKKQKTVMFDRQRANSATEKIWVQKSELADRSICNNFYSVIAMDTCNTTWGDVQATLGNKFLSRRRTKEEENPLDRKARGVLVLFRRRGQGASRGGIGGRAGRFLRVNV